MPRPKTITVSLSIRFKDPSQWERAFGVPLDDMTDDVRAYVLNLIQQSQTFGDECDTEVKLRHK